MRKERIRCFLNSLKTNVLILTFKAADDSIATEPEEYEGNWKRRKVAHSDDEENADQKKTEASEEQSETEPKNVDGEDKYDPMEAENESEGEEAPVTEQAKGDESQVDEEGGQQNDEDQKTKDDKVDWSDGENEFESEVGNLMDDTGDDKETVEQDTSINKVDTPKAVTAGRGRTPNQRARGQRARRSRR